jgi:hypothetical protein
MPTSDLSPHHPSSTAWRRWSARVTAAAIGFGLLVPATNLLVDPYDVFGTSPIGFGVTTNQRFHHARRLMENPSPVDVLLLGDSVMGINDPRQLQHLFPDRTVYNGSFFMASMVDLSQFFEATLRTKRPQIVLVGLDPFLFVDKGARLSTQMTMPPSVTGGSALAFWREMTLASSAFQSVNKVVESLKSVPSIRFDPVHGHYELPELNHRIAHDHAAFVQTRFGSASIHPGIAKLDHRQFDAMQSLQHSASSRGVRLLWVLQPTSFALRTAIGDAEHERVLALIRARVPGHLADLTDLTAISDDPYQWYDSRHYLPSTGHRLLSVALQRSAGAPLHAAQNLGLQDSLKSIR